MAVEGVSKEAGVGTRTTLNILDAEKELTQSESNLVNSQYQLIIFFRIIKTLWSFKFFIFRNLIFLICIFLF